MGGCLMAPGCGINAIHAADHIVLSIFIEQHAAFDAESAYGGADFHVQIAPTGKALTLNIQGGFAGVLLKEFCQVFNVEHWQYPNSLPSGLFLFRGKDGCRPPFLICDHK